MPASDKPLAAVIRYFRSSMREVMNLDFIQTARAKGLSRARIIFIHVFKNALTPLLTVGGPLAAGLIVGSFFVESIFRWGEIFSKEKKSTYKRKMIDVNKSKKKRS